MFYGWASPSVATSQFVCRGVGLTEPERSSLWNLSDVSTLDKAGLNLAPRYVATSVYDGDSVRTIISEIIDGRRMRYLVDGSNLIWIGEETPEMHIRVDTLCYTSALLPFGDVSIPLSLHYRSNVIRSDGALVQSTTYYPYGEPHRDPAASATIGIAGPEQQTASATFSNPYLYGGKEYVRRDGLREYIYGARMSVPSVTRFGSMDKHAENYPSFSPYAFCMCNPINFMDPSGMTVVADSIAQIAILDGFDDYAQKYIEFDDEGRLNIDKISEYDGDSENMASLRRLATSTIEYIIEYTDKSFVGNEVKTLSEELGNIADTTFPDNPYKNGYNTTNSRSIDDNVRIYCGSFLVGEHRATNIAHKLYGHADFYEQGLDPMHDYKISQGEDFRIFILTDANITLDNRIKRAKDEARRNYKKKHP